MQPSFFHPDGTGPGAARLLAAIDPALTEAAFDELALALLRQQAATNPAYARFLRACGVDPDAVGHWSAFPALPASSFKDQAVCAFSEEESVAVFETSGTTGGRPGRHHFRSLSYYEASLEAAWRHFLPDLSHHHWVSLIPPASIKPASSLSHMITHLARRVAKHEPVWCCDAGYRIDRAAFQSALDQVSGPVLLLGTSFALAAVAEAGPSRMLPRGSVIFDTGGYKGRHREIPRADFFALVSGAFGVPLSSIWNEYGMTEWSSQGYARADDGRHRFPPWMRIVLRDPGTGMEVPPGAVGQVEAYDLANVGSVMAVATRDLARWEEGGLCLLGRQPRAEARGCSLPFE